MALLLVMGFYFPTSDTNGISLQWNLTSGALLLLLLVALLAHKNGVLGVIPVLNVAAINLVVFVCTLFSPFTRFAFGGYVPILLLSTLFCLNVKEINLSVTARRLFDALNSINIALAGLLLLSIPEVRQFFLDHYAYGYDELLPYMLEGDKPVLTFGSHSLASFFFYLLFYLNIETYIKIRARLNLLFAFCYLALLLTMSSFTSVVLVVVATIQVVLCFQWHRSILAGFVTSALLLAAAAAAPQLEKYSTIEEDVREVLHREDNGLLGRYSSVSGLSVNFQYILDHPLRPIGLGFSEDLWYADSGPVEYILKGSFPLLAAVYVGAFLFFYRNLKSRSRAFFIFLVFMGFEIGYSNLQYLRTQYFLPFLVVYLNWLDTPKADLRPSHA